MQPDQPEGEILKPSSPEQSTGSSEQGSYNQGSSRRASRAKQSLRRSALYLSLMLTGAMGTLIGQQLVPNQRPAGLTGTPPAIAVGPH
jgi:hypothetical protein